MNDQTANVVWLVVPDDESLRDELTCAWELYCDAERYQKGLRLQSIHSDIMPINFWSKDFATKHRH